MKTNDLKPKPCPKCGSTEISTIEGERSSPLFYRAYCQKCGIDWHTFETGDFSGWNTRPIEDGLQAEIEGLKNVLMEIRDLARTGSAPDSLNLDTEEKWLRYKVNRIAAMADKGRE